MSDSLRFRFTREEGLKFIGHLDVLRLFERALKRSALQISHTQGFNPRMKLVFGLPMALGLTSEAEYADIELDAPMAPEAFIACMNEHLPLGIRVLAAAPIRESDNIMNIIKAARYDITVLPAKEIVREDMVDRVHRMLAAESLIVPKKTKKGMKDVDIRPLIYALTAGKADERAWTLGAFMSAGAVDNLRPELIIDAFTGLTGESLSILSIHRKALYVSHDNAWLNPMDESIL